MKRTSTDAEYLDSGKIVLDADGIPLEPASKGYVDQAIRVDTTVGTRVFTGNQMIYGDTGWRNVTNASYTGSLVIRRVGEMVMVRLTALAPPEDVVIPTVANLPIGFQSAGRTMGPITRMNSLGTQGRLWIEGDWFAWW